jgi:hypothetical protein
MLEVACAKHPRQYDLEGRYTGNTGWDAEPLDRPMVSKTVIDSDVDCLEELPHFGFAKEEDQHLLGDFTGEDNAGFCFNDVHSRTLAGV